MPEVRGGGGLCCAHAQLSPQPQHAAPIRCIARFSPTPHREEAIDARLDRVEHAGWLAGVARHAQPLRARHAARQRAVQGLAARMRRRAGGSTRRAGLQVQEGGGHVCWASPTKKLFAWQLLWRREVCGAGCFCSTRLRASRRSEFGGKREKWSEGSGFRAIAISTLARFLPLLLS